MKMNNSIPLSPADGLLNTRFSYMPNNTVDYWLTDDSKEISMEQISFAIRNATISENATLQLYIHVPFCAQKCTFCAFNGGNILDLNRSKEYSRLLIIQLNRYMEILPVDSLPISSVHIGGGSPDLLKDNIDYVLNAIRVLPGYHQGTEISVECALSTVSKPFLEAVCNHKITKISFGIQSVDPCVRKWVLLPRSFKKMDYLCDKVEGKIPIVNVDLMTGLPGQDLKSVDRDIRYFLAHNVVNSISSYMFAPGAAPALVAGLNRGEIPPLPPSYLQAHMRLHTYSSLQRAGWIRKGTSTYMDPSVISKEVLCQIKGNECIGAGKYEDFLIGIGCQAVGYIPGARLEHIVDISHWTSDIEAGNLGINVDKSALRHLKDIGLWTFPLKPNGLKKETLDSLINNNSLSEEQIKQFHTYRAEGLIMSADKQFELTILGEVFMGHLVKGLKKDEEKKYIDDYIEEGYKIGEAISQGRLGDDNAVNNRQLADIHRFHDSEKPIKESI